MMRDKYTIIVFGGVLVLLAPVLALLVLAIGGVTGFAETQTYGGESLTDIWSHLLATTLPRQFFTTLALMLGVGLFTSFFGVGAAWFMTFYAPPKHRWFEWLMLLPLALPTYLSAYVYVEITDTSGPFARLWQALPFDGPNMNHLLGAVFCMGLVLTPYVYVSARASFMKQSAQLIDAARLLGAGPLTCFWRIGLPLCRPAIFVGVALALMECLNDIGAVEYLGVETLTIGVYDTWLARGQLGTAIQLALVLLCLMGFLILVEKMNRAKDAQRNAMSRASKAAFAFTKQTKFLALTICGVPVVFGFILPVLTLLILGGDNLFQVQSYLPAMQNSFLLAGLAAIVTLTIGLFLAIRQRLRPAKTNRHVFQAAATGYAVPGTVLGLGVLVFFSMVDTNLAPLNGFFNTQFFLTGSLIGLIFAYTVRFLSISFGSMEAGLAQISPKIDMAASSLGNAGWQRVRQIYIPLLRPSLLAAFILVFVDTLKELPATLILRPFDFETLATQVYSKASLGLIEEAALPALMIVASGILPVIFASKLMSAPSSGQNQ